MIIPEPDNYPRGTTYSYYIYFSADGVTADWNKEPTLMGVQEGVTLGYFDTCRWVYPQGTTHANYNITPADWLGELIE